MPLRAGGISNSYARFALPCLLAVGGAMRLILEDGSATCRLCIIVGANPAVVSVEISSMVGRFTSLVPVFVRALSIATVSGRTICLMERLSAVCVHALAQAIISIEKRKYLVFMAFRG